MSIATEHFRLTILRLLSGAPGYRANSSVIHSAVGDFGFAYTRDQIKTELAWLDEQGLVKTRDMSGLVIAALTDRGLDVADGRAVAPGVQRPSPGS